MSVVYSTKDVAVMMNVPTWRIVRLFELGLVDEPPQRIGGKRAISRDQLPAIITALAAHKWLTGAVQFDQPALSASA